ncbi:MAG: SIMPL domain-containing protein [Aeromonadaceae bacterium]
MQERSIISSALLGALLCVGLTLLGVMVAEGFIKFREADRVVSVKGLSEREVAADVAIWPIRFSEVDNNLGDLFSSMESKNEKIQIFLRQQGFTVDEITVAVPGIQDRQAQGFSEEQVRNGRYAGTSTITVYSTDVEKVRKAMTSLVQLGQNGIAISGQDYDAKTQFLFTQLNDIKPAMIEQATRNAREVAEKFAHDSGSKLGKIKRAMQGQFTIEDRDSSTPYIKKVRIVSTIEYYLVD